jgi:hypothetical protein
MYSYFKLKEKSKQTVISIETEKLIVIEEKNNILKGDSNISSKSSQSSSGSDIKEISS